MMKEESIPGNGIGRRDFLKASTGSALALTLAGLTPSLARSEPQSRPPAFRTTAISLNDCIRMSPATMAERSAMVKSSYDYLLKSCSLISDATHRRVALECLKNPTPRIMECFPSDVEKEAVKLELVAGGYLKPEATYEQFLPPCGGPHANVQSFATAPGSGWTSHHAYPGGLVTHVAVFLKCSLGLFDAYQTIYGSTMNRDLIVAAAMIHDAQKPWVFQWTADSTCLTESPIAGTGSHHVLAIADAMHRDLSPELIMTVACCHMHPGWNKEEAEVVGWLKAAGIMAGRDPIRLGVLAADGKTLPLPRRQEGFICHMGDHDYVLTAPAASWMVAKLRDIARKEYGMTDADLQGRTFNSFRNYLFSQASVMRLHQTWVDGGEAALTETVRGIVTA